MKKFLALILALLMMLSLIACGAQDEPVEPAEEQTPALDYPTKPITFVVEYSAGGSSDLLVRAFCSIFEKHVGVKVNVENVPGGGGATGATYMLSQPADGYTLFYGTSGVFTTLPYTQEVEYDPVEDFKYVCAFAQHDVLLVVPADSPYETLDDYIAAAKAAGPDGISYGQSSPGGSTHMIMEQFQETAGIDLNMIAYENGAAEITAALLGGHLESAQLHPSDVIEHVKAGKLRVIGIFSDERRAAFPDTPTMKECGIDIVAGLPRGICVVKDTPDEIVEWLDQKVQETMADPDYAATMANVNEADSILYRDGETFKQSLIDMTESAVPIMKRLGYID